MKNNCSLIPLALVIFFLYFGFSSADVGSIKQSLHQVTKQLFHHATLLDKQSYQLASSVSGQFKRANPSGTFATTAISRKKLLLELLKEDPKSAREFMLPKLHLDAMLSKKGVQQSTEALSSLFEREVEDYDASLMVMCVEGIDQERNNTGDHQNDNSNQNLEHHDHKDFERLVEIHDGETSRLYEAKVYGAMEQMQTMNHIHLKGFLIDDIVLIEEETFSLNPESQQDDDTNSHGDEEESNEANDVSTRNIATIARSHTIGSKTLLYIRVDFPDLVGSPVAESSINPVMQQTREFFKKNSYNQMDLSRWVITPTIRLPQSSSFYRNNYVQLLRDATSSAATRGYNQDRYSFHIVAFRRIFPSWAGRGYVGRAGLWLNGEFGFRVTTHELGHNLGLWHANLYQSREVPRVPWGGRGSHVEYGDTFDIMGQVRDASGNFNLRNKLRLHWAPITSMGRVTQSGLYTIFAHDDERSSGKLRGLQIVHDRRRPSNFFYVVSFRSNVKNNRFYTSGRALEIHMTYDRYTSQNSTHLIDATPTSAGGSIDAALSPGMTFRDNHASPRIQILFDRIICDRGEPCKAVVRVSFTNVNNPRSTTPKIGLMRGSNARNQK